MIFKVKTFWLFIFIAIIFTIIAVFYINRHYKTPVVTMPILKHRVVKKIENNIAASTTNSKLTIPDSKYIPVPFTPQAPTGNWDELHNEACEEAAALMAAAYFKKIFVDAGAVLAPKIVEEEITKLTQWQNKNFGYFLDTTSEETAKMIQEVYGLQTQIIQNFSSQNVKKAIMDEKIVIISENGRKLNNPYYKQPGPIHHMLLIKGFDGENFVSNDSGTKRGLNYVYDFETIYNAAADWDHNINSVDNNKKVAIIIWK